MTIPRLELCAAVIAVRMDRMLSRELTLEIQDSVFWTEGKIVLQAPVPEKPIKLSPD